MGTYLEQAKARYEGYRNKISELRDAASSENRALTDEEFRAIEDNAAKAQTELDQITTLNEQEVRDAKVGQLAATLSGAQGDGAETGDQGGTTGTRAAGGTTTTNQRDPGHYRSVAERGTNSFFGDIFASRHSNNAAATQRLNEHMNFMAQQGFRAVTQASGGTGIVPPKWLSDEYLKMGRQGRVVANLVRRIPLGTDPRPLILPKQTAKVDQNLTAQTTEGANNASWGADRFTTNKDTLTPETDAAYQDVSRQMLGASTPAADVLIAQDLHDAWDDKMELGVCTAIAAGATAFKTLANEAAFTTEATTTDTGNPLMNDSVDAQTAVANALYGPADITIMNYGRFGQYRKLTDLNGRRLMPITRYNPQNAQGSVGNALVGDIEGTDGYATVGLGIKGTNYPDNIVTLRSSAVLFAESDLLEFNYEQIVGPSSVRMGIWGYWGVLVRVAAAVQSIVITAAS